MHINWEVTTRFDPNSLEPSTHGIPIPSYGNYGGPNYSAGVENGRTPETPNPPPLDALDALFYEHDLVYQHVQDGTAPPTAIAQADVHLVEAMYGLTQTDPALFANDHDLRPGWRADRYGARPRRSVGSFLGDCALPVASPAPPKTDVFGQKRTTSRVGASPPRRCARSCWLALPPPPGSAAAEAVCPASGAPGKGEPGNLGTFLLSLRFI